MNAYHQRKDTKEASPQSLAFQIFQVLTCLLVVLQFTWREDLFQLAIAIWKSLCCMFITSIVEEIDPPPPQQERVDDMAFAYSCGEICPSLHCVILEVLLIYITCACSITWRSKAGWQAGLARVSCLRQKFTSTTTHKVFAFVEYTRGIFFRGWGLCHVWVSWMNLTWLHYDWYGSARSHPVTSTTTNSGKC